MTPSMSERYVLESEDVEKYTYTKHRQVDQGEVLWSWSTRFHVPHDYKRLNLFGGEK
jgi:hypothetical protein